MINPFKQLLDLLPNNPLLVGQVVLAGATTATVQYPGGGSQIVRGAGLIVGAKVFVRDGSVEGVAPNLPIVIIEV